ncbi:DUF3566 domain-containing protein [Saccharopolyspora erythraea]|uniref:DUF3566 domain-containing protein n=1 Tax=Saccharopolyspora erythraea TaxID=1836 RepID=UPI001BA53607|nr:DUF3566 domain-containing protein [Saccharopolyspora erythraea]QUG99404.1 DUF3566 domain-containing protein [Saccharopolyspora erythraea]
MTPSEKPEESASQSKDASRTSVITQSEEANESTAERGTPAAEDQAPNHGEEAAALDGTDAPPPWQRGAATSSAGDQPSWPTEQPAGTSGSPAGAGGAPDSEDTQKIPRPAQEQETARNEVPQSSSGGRTAVTFGSTGRATTAGSARRPSRGPRRASLQVKRIDPWSVLKLALVLSVALFFVWMIAVAVLYGVLDGMGVWDQLNGTFTELTQPDDAAAEPLISAGRVFGVASIIGAINIVLITALATVAAFIYNVAADFAGGVEVTLSERE